MYSNRHIKRVCNDNELKRKKTARDSLWNSRDKRIADASDAIAWSHCPAGDVHIARSPWTRARICRVPATWAGVRRTSQNCSSRRRLSYAARTAGKPTTSAVDAVNTQPNALAQPPIHTLRTWYFAITSLLVQKTKSLKHCTSTAA